jgi:hypothetical protein
MAFVIDGISQFSMQRKNLKTCVAKPTDTEEDDD